MSRVSDEYETQLYECFYSSLLHLISKAVIKLQLKQVDILKYFTIVQS